MLFTPRLNRMLKAPVLVKVRVKNPKLSSLRLSDRSKPWKVPGRYSAAELERGWPRPELVNRKRAVVSQAPQIPFLRISTFWEKPAALAIRLQAEPRVRDSVRPKNRRERD